MTYHFNFAQLLPYTGLLLDGLQLTLIMGVQAMAYSLVVGIAGAIGRQYGPWPLRALITVYVEFIRNTPLLVQIFLIFFMLPKFGLRLDPVPAGLIALVINGGAHLTEIVRAGIVAVPIGQVEAGRALGLKPHQVFFDIVCRPAIRIVYPAVASEFIVLLLATSVCSQIAVNELTARANQIDSNTFRSLEIYVVMCVIYVILSISFATLFRAIEKVALNWRT